jgi:hypothetical protein
MAGVHTMLTDVRVKQAKSREKPYKLSDSGNLFLWVTPTGGKIWRWAYRIDGKAKLMTLGKYPDVPLALARTRHGDARKLLAMGVDPMVKRKPVKTAERVPHENSFASVTAQWLAHWKEGKSPRHVDSTRRRLAANILPVLGARPVAEIEAPELVTMVRLIDSRGARDIAKRALETTGQIFRYSIAHGYAKRNPATEIRPRDILRSAQNPQLRLPRQPSMCSSVAPLLPRTAESRPAVQISQAPRGRSLPKCPRCGGVMLVLERLTSAQLHLRAPQCTDRCAA